MWENVLCDYTCGLVVVLAHSEEEAWDLIYREDKCVWSELMFGGELNYFSDEIKEILKEYKEKRNISIDVSQAQKIWLERHNVKLYKNAIRPKEVTKPNVFYVWGGG